MKDNIGITPPGIPTVSNKIPSDLWGIIYGYPLDEVHQFTYDWKEWKKRI